jgi:hypothetical protein
VRDGGPGLVQLKVDVAPISFYTDALPNWRARNKEKDWDALSDEVTITLYTIKFIFIYMYGDLTLNLNPKL